MKKSKIVAGISALAISFSVFSAPQALAYEPGTEPVSDEEKQQGAQEISFADSDGTEILPEETLTFTADDWEEGIGMRNAYIETAAGHTSPLWDVERGTDEDGAPQLTITAPTEPEEQFTSTPQEYGEYLVHIRTSNWNSAYFNINFVEERTPEEDDNGQDDNGQDDNGQDDNGQDDNGQDDNGQDDNGQDDNGQENPQEESIWDRLTQLSSNLSS